MLPSLIVLPFLSGFASSPAAADHRGAQGDNANNAGVCLVHVSAETWSAAPGQANASGAAACFVGTFDDAVDSTNAAGATALIGQIAPSSALLDADGNGWLVR